MEVYKQGAEAKLYKCQLFGRDVIVKQRFSKKYRHPQLDQKLTRKRTLQEARAMLKCRKAGIKAPLPFYINYDTHEIYMEDINNSTTLRELIDSLLHKHNSGDAAAKHKLKGIAEEVGKIVARLHTINIVHGDLTTSNVLVEQKDESTDGELTFTLIDFGLSYTSDLYEDFGVDLYVLERAFLSTHPNTEWMFQVLLDTYMGNIVDVKKRDETLSKLEEIRLRGRKRVMVG